MIECLIGGMQGSHLSQRALPQNFLSRKALTLPTLSVAKNSGQTVHIIYTLLSRKKATDNDNSKTSVKPQISTNTKQYCALPTDTHTNNMPVSRKNIPPSIASNDMETCPSTVESITISNGLDLISPQTSTQVDHESSQLFPGIPTHNRYSPISRDLDLFSQELNTYSSSHIRQGNAPNEAGTSSSLPQTIITNTDHFLVQSPTNTSKEKGKIEEIDVEEESAKLNHKKRQERQLKQMEPNTIKIFNL